MAAARGLRRARRGPKFASGRERADALKVHRVDTEPSCKSGFGAMNHLIQNAIRGAHAFRAELGTGGLDTRRPELWQSSSRRPCGAANASRRRRCLLDLVALLWRQGVRQGGGEEVVRVVVVMVVAVRVAAATEEMVIAEEARWWRRGWRWRGWRR